MAEEPNAAGVETEPAPSPGDPVVVPPTPESAPQPPSPDEQMQQLREENARLQGQVSALSRPPAAPASTSDATRRAALESLTPELIEQSFAKGEIDDAGRIRLHAQLEARKMRAEDEERRSLDEANAELGRYMTEHPDLTRPGTPLLNEVGAELRTWSRLNPRLDPSDPRTQVLVTKAVLERKGNRVPAPDPREYNRLRIPVGSVGSPAAAAPGPEATPKKSKGEALWAKLTPDAKLFYQSYESPGNPGAANMQRVFKTLEHADEDLLRRKGRLVS